MSLNYTWAPEYSSDIHFTDCDQAAQLWQAFELTPTKRFDNDTIAQAVLDGLQDYLRSNGNYQPTLDQVYQWTSRSRLVTYALETMLYEKKLCKNKICPIMGWEGNSDITGRGMLVTYFLQAILVTCYIPTLLAIRFGKTPNANGKHRLVERTLFALKHSTASFLNASFVFAIAMLSGSLISFAKTFGYDALTLSGSVLTLLMPLSSVFPAILLHLTASNMLRRDRGRVFLWRLIGILIVNILALALIPEKSIKDWDNFGEKYYSQAEWEEACIEVNAALHLYYLALAFAGSLLIGIVGYAIPTMVTKLRHRPFGP